MQFPEKNPTFRACAASRARPSARAWRRAAVAGALVVAAVAAPGGAQQLGIQSAASSFTAAPEPDYYVSGWTGDCNPDPAVNPNAANVSVSVGDPVAEGGGVPQTCILDPAPESAGNVAATFARVPTRDIHFPQPAGGGTVVVVAVIPADPDAEPPRPDSSEVTLVSGDGVSVHLAVLFAAKPDDDYFVESWTGTACENAPTGEADSAGGGDKYCDLAPALSDAFVTVALSSVRECGGDFRADDSANLTVCGNCLLGYEDLSPSDSADACVPETRLASFARAPDNGTLAAASGGNPVVPGEPVPVSAPVTFTAEPASAGYYVESWTGACAGADTGETDSAGGAEKQCVVSAAGPGAADFSVSVAFAAVRDCSADSRQNDNVSECGLCEDGRYWNADNSECAEIGAAFALADFETRCEAAKVGANSAYSPAYYDGTENLVGHFCGKTVRDGPTVDSDGNALKKCYLILDPDFDADVHALDGRSVGAVSDLHDPSNPDDLIPPCHSEFPECPEGQADHDGNPFTPCLCPDGEYWDGSACEDVGLFAADDFETLCTDAGGSYSPAYYDDTSILVGHWCGGGSLPAGTSGSDCYVIVDPNFDPDSDALDGTGGTDQHDPLNPNDTGANFRRCHTEYPECVGGMIDGDNNPFTPCVENTGELRPVNFSANAGGELLVTVADAAVRNGAAVDSAQPVTFVAVPTSLHYVSEWTGDCDGSDSGQYDSAGGGSKECVIPAGESTVYVTVAFAPAADCEGDNRVRENVSECGECEGAFYWNGSVCTTVLFDADAFRADCRAAGGSRIGWVDVDRDSEPVVQHFTVGGQENLERRVGQYCYSIGGDNNESCFLVTHPDFDRDSNAFSASGNSFSEFYYEAGDPLCHEKFPESSHVCDGTTTVDHDDNPFTACVTPRDCDSENREDGEHIGVCGPCKDNRFWDGTSCSDAYDVSGFAADCTAAGGTPYDANPVRQDIRGTRRDAALFCGSIGGDSSDECYMVTHPDFNGSSGSQVFDADDSDWILGNEDYCHDTLTFECASPLVDQDDNPFTPCARDCSPDNREPDGTEHCGVCSDGRHWDGTSCTDSVFNADTFRTHCADAGGSSSPDTEQTIRGASKVVGFTCAGYGGVGSNKCFLVTHPEFDESATASSGGATFYQSGDAFCRDEFSECVSPLTDHDGNPFTACIPPQRVVNFSHGVGGTLVAVSGDGVTLASGDFSAQSVAVTFTADADEDYYVSEWTGDCAGSDTGAADPAAGGEKVCVVAAGSATVYATVSFATAGCADLYREAGATASACGGCLEIAELRDGACVPRAVAPSDFHAAAASGTPEALVSLVAYADAFPAEFAASLTLTNDNDDTPLQSALTAAVGASGDLPGLPGIVSLFVARGAATTLYSGSTNSGNTDADCSSSEQDERWNFFQYVAKSGIAEGSGQLRTEPNALRLSVLAELGRSADLEASRLDCAHPSGGDNGEGLLNEAAYFVLPGVFSAVVNSANRNLEQKSAGNANAMRDIIFGAIDSSGGQDSVGMMRELTEALTAEGGNFNQRYSSDDNSGDTPLDVLVLRWNAAEIATVRDELAKLIRDGGGDCIARDTNQDVCPRLVSFVQPSANGSMIAEVGGAEVESGRPQKQSDAVTFTAIPLSTLFYVESWGGDCAGVGQTGEADPAGGFRKTCEITGGTADVSAEVVISPVADCASLLRDPKPGNVGLCGPCSGNNVDQGGPRDSGLCGSPPENTRQVLIGQDPDGNGTLTAVDPDGGLLDGAYSSVAYTIVATADPDALYYVSEWTGDCAGVGGTGVIYLPDEDRTCEVVPGTNNVSIGVVFSEYVGRTVYYSVEGVGGSGDLSATSDGRDVPDAGRASRTLPITFAADPSAERYVSGWGGDCASASAGDFDSPDTTLTCVVDPGDVDVSVAVTIANARAFYNRELNELGGDDKPELARALEFLDAGAVPSAAALNEAASRPYRDTGLSGNLWLDRAQIVSVLVTAGAPVDHDRSVPGWVGRNSDNGSVRETNHQILRHFIGALGVTATVFNWNAEYENSTPLSWLRSHCNRGSFAELCGEMAALMFERGSRCADGRDEGEDREVLCRVPEETISPPILRADTGAIVTVEARDFGPDTFDLQLPDAAKVAELTMAGWDVELQSDSRPHRVVLSRPDENVTDSAVFVVTAFYDSTVAVRHVNVSLGFGDPAAALREAIASGDPARVSLALDDSNVAAEVNTESDGRTPLHRAILLRTPAAVEMARHLLANGANVESEMTGAKRPLHLAIDIAGPTSAEIAAMGDRRDQGVLSVSYRPFAVTLVETLLELGADPAAIFPQPTSTELENNPQMLLYALSVVRTPILRNNNGNSVNNRDGVEIEELPRIIGALLDNGADPNYGDSIALHYAARNWAYVGHAFREFARYVPGRKTPDFNVKGERGLIEGEPAETVLDRFLGNRCRANIGKHWSNSGGVTFGLEKRLAFYTEIVQLLRNRNAECDGQANQNNDCSGVRPRPLCRLDSNDPSTRTVNFVQPTAGTLSASAGGTNIPAGGLIGVEATITLTADPDDEHYVDSWGGDCETQGTSGAELTVAGIAQTCVVEPGSADLHITVFILPAADCAGLNRKPHANNWVSACGDCTGDNAVLEGADADTARCYPPGTVLPPNFHHAAAAGTEVALMSLTAFAAAAGPDFAASLAIANDDGNTPLQSALTAAVDSNSNLTNKPALAAIVSLFIANGANVSLFTGTTGGESTGGYTQDANACADLSPETQFNFFMYVAASGITESHELREQPNALRLAVLEELAKTGLDVTRPNCKFFNSTLAHASAFWGHLGLMTIIASAQNKEHINRATCHQHGCAVVLQDVFGGNAHRSSTDEESVELIRLLISAGADPNRRKSEDNNSGNNALRELVDRKSQYSDENARLIADMFHRAGGTCVPSSTDDLCDPPEDPPNFHAAAAAGTAEALAELSDYLAADSSGFLASLAVANADNNTPLQTALTAAVAANGDLPGLPGIVSLFVENAAAVTLFSGTTNGPADADCGTAEQAERWNLFQYAAKSGIAEADGELQTTPNALRLSVLAQLSQSSLAEPHRADCGNGDKGLHMDAAEFGMGELLRIVAEAESDLNANTGGETALREALNGRNAGRWTAAEIANIIALLLNNGADATAVVEVNSQNESALDLLVQLKDEANFADGLAATLAKLLLAAGGECQTETDADLCPTAVVVNFSQTDGGTLYAQSGGATLSGGETFAPPVAITFTADPDETYSVASWAGDCRGIGDVAADPSDTDPKTCVIMRDYAGSLETSVAFAPGNVDEILVAEAAKTDPAAPNIAQVRRLLNDLNADPDAEDDNGVPVLLLAAVNLHAEMVSILVTAGADITAARSDGINGGPDYGAVPHLMVVNPLSGTPADCNGTTTALVRDIPKSARVLKYFNDALSVSNRTYLWDEPYDYKGGNDLRPGGFLPWRFANCINQNNEADIEAFIDISRILGMHSTFPFNVPGEGRCDNQSVVCRHQRVVNFPAPAELTGGSVSVALVASGVSVSFADAGTDRAHIPISPGDTVDTRYSILVTALPDDDHYVFDWFEKCDQPGTNGDPGTDGDPDNPGVPQTCLLPRPTSNVDAALTFSVSFAKPVNGKLLAEVNAASPSPASVVALLNDGASADFADRSGNPVLVLAAAATPSAGDSSVAEIVSVLITAGADPDATHSQGRTAPMIVAHATNDAATLNERLDIIRHFIAALGVRHSADSSAPNHDWTATDGDGDSALKILDERCADTEPQTCREIADLLYERGARCGGNNNGDLCELPFDDIVMKIDPAFTGDLHTVVARDFGRSEFNLAVPAGATANGWALQLNSARPQQIVLSRTATADPETTPEGVFTVTITREGGGTTPVREARISADFVGNLGDKLVAELSEATPDLASVVALLDDGANPNAVRESQNPHERIPVLLLAALSLNADAVSILVTADANISVAHPDPAEHNNPLPHLMAINKCGSGIPGRDWTESLQVLRHFNNALAVAGKTYDYAHSAGDSNTTALGYLIERFNNCTPDDGEDGDAILQMRDILRVGLDGNPITCSANDIVCDVERTITFPAAGQTRGVSFSASALGWDGATIHSVAPGQAVDSRYAVRIFANPDDDRYVSEWTGHCATQGRGTLGDINNLGEQVRCDLPRLSPPSDLSADVKTFSRADISLIAEVAKANADPEVVRDLVENHGADPDRDNDNGDSVMVVAAENLHPEIVSILITAGANISATQSGGETLPVPHLLAINGCSGSGNDRTPVRAWPESLAVLQHFHNAVLESGQTYDYTYTDGGANRPAVGYLSWRYFNCTPDDDVDGDAILQMRNILLGPSGNVACTDADITCVPNRNIGFPAADQLTGGELSVVALAPGGVQTPIQPGATDTRFSVMFTAVPDDGYYVSGWTNDCASTGTVGDENNPGVPQPCGTVFVRGTVDISVNVSFASRAAELLVAEIQMATPNLASVAALLGENANPDQSAAFNQVALPTGENLAAETRPLLVQAARRGMADLVSVLITAGADPETKDNTNFNRRIPNLLAFNPPGGLGLTYQNALEVLQHYAEALEVRRAAEGGGEDAVVQWWNFEGGFDATERPLNALPGRYQQGDLSGQTVAISMMAQFIRNYGGECNLASSHANHDHELCTLTPDPLVQCDATLGEVPRGPVCGCPDDHSRTTTTRKCVPDETDSDGYTALQTANACESAGWQLNEARTHCEILIYDWSGPNEEDRCKLAGIAREGPCDNYFTDTDDADSAPNFPQYDAALDDPTRRRFVAFCGQHPTLQGSEPSGRNNAGQTECAVPPPPNLPLLPSGLPATGDLNNDRAAAQTYCPLFGGRYGAIDGAIGWLCLDMPNARLRHNAGLTFTEARDCLWNRQPITGTDAASACGTQCAPAQVVRGNECVSLTDALCKSHDPNSRINTAQDGSSPAGTECLCPHSGAFSPSDGTACQPPSP